MEQIINATRWSRTFHLELASILKPRARGDHERTILFFFHPSKCLVWTSRHWWQSMVSIIRERRLLKHSVRWARPDQDFIILYIYLPLINLHRNIYKGLWGEPGSRWATLLICVTTWCFLLYIGVYDCCYQLFECMSYERGIKLCKTFQSYSIMFSFSLYVYIFKTSVSGPWRVFNLWLCIYDVYLYLVCASDVFLYSVKGKHI